jgi:hypothetical protein
MDACSDELFKRKQRWHLFEIFKKMAEHARRRTKDASSARFLW